jgi:hypothetical protein
MFLVSLIHLTQLFPYGINFVHRGFTVRGGFQERNPRERRGCTVLSSHLYVCPPKQAQSFSFSDQHVLYSSHLSHAFYISRSSDSTLFDTHNNVW